jgi:hypothetical protein
MAMSAGVSGIRRRFSFAVGAALLACSSALSCGSDDGNEIRDTPDAASGGSSGATGGSGARPSAGGSGNAPSAGGSGNAPSAGGSGGSGASSGSGGSSGTSPIADGSSGAGGTGARLPADLLDLTNWKLTLPTGSSGSPTEIEQPELATFELAPYFHLNPGRDGVLFRAHAGGVTTSGSSYPRSELREMTNRGADLAAWSTTSGVHTMTVTYAILQIPAVKPHVVAGQIHDSSDDVVMIRLEGTNLFVEGGGNDLGNLKPDYQLGTRFTVRLSASGGRIRIFYEDMTTPKVDVARSATGCYFKAGAYTQSNPSRGDAPDAYGEVVIFSLDVTHQ